MDRQPFIGVIWVLHQEFSHQKQFSLSQVHAFKSKICKQSLGLVRFHLISDILSSTSSKFAERFSQVHN
ncbi:CLUMA_CG002757, isoform A [Clunio marinus]|uniref:CLUMA_CG002757, isoform A n=1 Tax=Clunio marinus TaxID=568069 RepID=A0A1J1HRC0_9DIPT|nr:CLUMA_CG002757, isoform A [Clunio marinus]